ncbi:MAG: DUF4382 domain-containing protein [Phycisphaerae bacterium]
MKKIYLSKTVAVFISVFGLSSFFVGCGNNPLLSGAGTVSVKLVDAPVSGYKEINIHVLRVEIAQGGQDNSSWVTLGTPDVTVNLLTLTNGVSETLVPGTSLAAGHYGQMRLILGSGNTVKLADDSVHDLTVPSGLKTGIKLIVNFDVVAGTTTDVFIDFDAANSIHLNHTGHSDKYMLRPTVRAFNRVLTGSISGRLTESDNGTALAGAIVTAQTIEQDNATIVRSAITDDNGTYLLDLLPIGATYYVVSQPVVSGVAYKAKTSDAISLTEQAPTAIYNAAFEPTNATGQVTGTITPTAGDNDSDIVNLTQSLMVGGNAKLFIVRTAVPVISNSDETYTMDLVPEDNYTAQATRVTTSDNGTTVQKSLSTPAVVTSGNVVAADLQF